MSDEEEHQFRCGESFGSASCEFQLTNGVVRIIVAYNFVSEPVVGFAFHGLPIVWMLVPPGFYPFANFVLVLIPPHFNSSLTEIEDGDDSHYL